MPTPADEALDQLEATSRPFTRPMTGQPKTLVDLFSKTPDPEVLEATRREARAHAFRAEAIAYLFATAAVLTVIAGVSVLPALIMFVWTHLT